MATLYADESFPVHVVEVLVWLGHDVLTANEAGQANRAVADDEVVELARVRGRAILTLNRCPFVALHARHPEHAGIIACTPDPDIEGQAARIDETLRAAPTLQGLLFRVDRPA